MYRLIPIIAALLLAIVGLSVLEDMPKPSPKPSPYIFLAPLPPVHLKVKRIAKVYPLAPPLVLHYPLPDVSFCDPDDFKPGRPVIRCFLLEPLVCGMPSGAFHPEDAQRCFVPIT